MSNESLANISGVTFDGDVSEEVAYRTLAFEITFTIIAVLGILADVAVIHTILRYKRLKTIGNILIVNWAIADLVVLMVAPSGYRIITLIDHIKLPYEFDCVLYTVGSVMHIMEVFVVITITVDWMLTSFFPRAAETCHRRYKYIVAAAWAIFLLYATACAVPCMFFYHTVINDLPTLIAVCAVILLVISAQICRLVKKMKNRPVENSCLQLNMATAFICDYGFTLLLVMLPFRVPRMIVFIAVCLLFSSGIINLIILCCCHKGFQACFLQTLRRKRVVYDDTASEFEVDPDVKVEYHNPTEKLLTNAY